MIKKCLGFDLKVSVYDPFVDEKTISSFGGKKVSDLNSSLKEADIVSLSLTKNKKTINYHHGAMKIDYRDRIFIKKNSDDILYLMANYLK